MHAIIAESGKQFFVRPGDTIRVDYREAEDGAPIEFGDVLLVSDGANNLAVGHPYLTGAKVVGTVVSEVRGPKIHVGVYKRRQNYRKHKGHRQSYTAVKINDIQFAG